MIISICIPTYEQIEYLKKAIHSILSQTYDNYEVIISDDSKSDIVLNYIKDLKSIFCGKLVYYRNDPPKGTPGNWNHVMNLAKGDFIHLLHHDDYYASPESLKNMIDAVNENSESDVFLGEVLSHNVANKTLTKLVVENTYLLDLQSNPSKILFANLLGPPSIVFIKRSALTYFDINLKWLVDIEFYFRIFKANMNWKYIRKPFVISVNNADHNVTKYCESNAEIEVYEYTYLYNRVVKGFFVSLSFLGLIRKLLWKYGLFSYKDVVNLCRTENVPWFYKPLIKLIRIEYAIKAK